MEVLKKYIGLLLMAIIIGLYGFNYYLSKQEDENMELFLNQYTFFNSSEKINDIPLTFKVLNNNKEVGFLVIDNENGYQSSITLATLIDLNGKIVDVQTYSENETPAFYKRIVETGFFESAFKDKFIGDGFKVGYNIDAISRATITSKAITKVVHKSAYYVGTKHLNIGVGNLYNGIHIGQLEISLFILLLLVVFAYYTKNRRLRYLVLIYSIVVIGFKFSQFISYSTFFAGITGKWPSLHDDFRWYILVFGALGLNLISGKNLYCAYMCPFGAAQELGNRFAKLHFFKVSIRVNRILRFIPGTLAYFALALALFTQQVGVLNYEPFSLLYGNLGTDIQWALLPLVIFTSLFVMRFYCHYACPVGYVLNLLLKLRTKTLALCTKK